MEPKAGRFAALTGGGASRIQLRILFTRVIGVVASFLVVTMLARSAGPATVGAYGFAIVTATTLAYICMLGLDQLVLRTVPADLAAGDSAGARRAVRVFAKRIGMVSLGVAAVFLIGFPLLPAIEFEGYRSVAQGTAALVVIYPLLRFGHNLLRAIGLPVRAQIVESMSATAMMVIIGGALLLGIVPSAPMAVIAFVLVSALLLLVAGILYRRSVRAWERGDSARPVPGFNAGFSFMFITLVHASTEWLAYYALLVGSNTEAVGVFRAVFQVAALLALVVQTGHNYVAPLIAGDLRRGDRAMALSRYRQSRRVMILLALLPTIVLLMAPGPFLLLAFGPAFEVGSSALTILVASQFVNVATGPVGTVLAMAGRERILLIIAVIAMALMVVLAWWLVPSLGLTGGAIALASATVLRNLATYVFARRVLHVPSGEG